MSTLTTPISRARVGDDDVFMQLLEPELPGAYRLAFALLRSQLEAEDAVQEAALKAWTSFGRFRRGEQLKPWFYAIVGNECRQRRRSRWWSVLRGLPEEPGLPIDSDPDTTDLRRAIARLPHDQRLALVLRYYLDMQFEEVAQTLGVSIKAAKSRTYRALEKLRMSPEVLSDE